MKTGIAIAATALLGAAPSPLDRDTRAWWAATAELSSDAMEGRDTGSAAYERAAQLVAKRFAAAGLKPAGDGGGWFQRVPMHEISITAASLSAGGRPLAFLREVTATPTAGMPTRIDVPLSYGGYCGMSQLGDVRGRFVICHGTRRVGLPTAAEREQGLRSAGAVGMLTIADPGFTIEPPRWPFAYARSLSLEGEGGKPDRFIKMTLNANALGKLLGPGPKDARGLIADGSAGRSLPSFAVPSRLRARFTIRERDISSSNVIGLLPGSDPAAANQAVVLTAHLDGYGYGEPVNGDRLYNGTLDDAAYVALLMRLAEQRLGRGFRRPVLFLVVTGEEKGLLGSRWFVRHPTVPLSRVAADINLDQLRPIFPLEILTVHAIDDTTLGDDARAVAEAMKIAVQRDPEPERNLLSRSDNWPFMQAGIPATGFVFGYRPGSRSERIYRQWYRTGYHKPQDDLRQAIDWKAAADFNRFFYALVDRVADQPSPPAWKSGSKLRPVK